MNKKLENALTSDDQKCDASVVSLADAQEALSLRNQQESPLLRLPGELRNKIYGYVVDDPIHIHFSLRRIERVGGGEYFHRSGPVQIHYSRQHIALNETCRQTHAETRILPFNSLYEVYGDADALREGICTKLTEEQRSTLRTVHVFTRGTSPSTWFCRQYMSRDYPVMHHMRGMEELLKIFRRLAKEETLQLKRIMISWRPYDEYANWVLTKEFLEAKVVDEVKTLIPTVDVEVNMIDRKLLLTTTDGR
ncbi:Nn.00g057650.m01.CDS01 [Neocucurbitaria sp. VM-36]